MMVEKCPCCGNENGFNSVPYDVNPSEHKWSYNCFSDKSLSVCAVCGTYFTREIILDDELNEFYSNIFDGQEDVGFNPLDKFEFTPRFLSQVLFLKTHLELFDGIKVLEIGPNSTGVLPTLLLFCKPLYYYFEQSEYPAITYFGGKRLGEYYSQDNFRKQNQMHFQL